MPTSQSQSITRAALEGMTLTQFMRLPAGARGQVDRWFSLLSSVTPPLVPALAAVAREMGVSFSTARRKYYTLRRGGGDWRALVDLRATTPTPAEPDLPEATVGWFEELIVANGRKIRPAWRQALRELRAGKPVPGLPPGWERHRMPPGWSYQNVCKRTRLGQFQLTAARVGRTAASAHRPHVHTTRVGLQVGQRIQFDDLWHDFMVVRVGSPKPMRLLQLSALDVFSACCFTRGLKPRIEDPESGKRLNLREDDMLFFLVHVLTDFGYHPDGCTLVVEHGTAAIREDIETLLHDLTGGKIRVIRSGIQSSAAHPGQFNLGTGGNFRLKAHLESLHNLIHNETANTLLLPGQTGSNARTNLPEELAGREKHLERLLKAAALLPQHLRDQFRLPFVEERVAVQLVNDLLELINCRHDHDLEGWEEAGLTTIDFEVAGLGRLTGSAVLALDPAKRAAIEAVATPIARKLSPREVFDTGRHRLTRLRPEQAARLLHGRQAVEATVRHGLITFENRAIAPGTLRYLAHHWTDGDKFAVVVNPFAPEVAHLFDARGAWVGTVQAWGRVPHHDTEALQAQMGRAARVEREMLEAVRSAAVPITTRRLEDARHNTRLIRQHAASLQADQDTATDALIQAMT